MAPMLCFRPSKKGNSGGSYKVARSKHGKNELSSEMAPSGAVDEGLSLQYVTKRIIVMTSPSNASEESYRESLTTVFNKLKTEHFEKFKIWNVSRARRDLSRSGPVVDIGWPEPLAPPLDRLCVMCKQWEQFLSSDSSTVIVVHSKGEPSRAAIVVCAYMHYNVICANDDSIEDRFSMQRYSDRFIGIHGQPSHKRYLTYFANLLSGKIRVNPAAVFLQKIILHKLPNREIYFKLYEKMKPIYTTDVGTSKDVHKVEIDSELKLRGDILLKCMEKKGDHSSTVFLCQFNTCALELIGKTPNLKFFKEELDLIFSESSIDNQCNIELSFSSEPLKKLSSRKSLSESDRTDSYEYFAVAEDDSTDKVEEYSEIQKLSPNNCISEDSGVSIESPKEDWMGPPPVPPKPRPGSSLAESISQQDTSQGEYVERRGILPAAVKPFVHRPQSPKDSQKENGGTELTKTAGRATPSIEPDLVGRDRYDKASKCFSYVPAKSLNEAFAHPKKTSTPQKTVDVKEIIDDVRPEDLSRAGELTKSHTDLVRRAESPKWTEEVENAKTLPGSVRMGDRPYGSTVDVFRRPETPKWDEEIERANLIALRDAEPFASVSRRVPERSQSVAAERFREAEEAEKPMVFDQARRATRATTPGAVSVGGFSQNGTMKRKTNYGSYRMLDDDNYNSDMDDLCDPEFYLNYSAPRPQAPKSEQLPRKQFKQIEPLSEFDDFNGQPTASCLDISQNPDRDAWRQRNCRSVAAAPTSPPSKKKSFIEKQNSPFFRDRKLFANEYNALSEADQPDDWLNTKLRKLKSKRDMDPDIVRRRTQEKMLLEELKNAHDDKEVVRGRAEKEFSVEGVGARVADPLEAYKREEERLRNTHSPFDDMKRRGLRGKPPTPPPRERSRSPTSRSEAPSRINTPSIEPSKIEQPRPIVTNGHVPHQNGHFHEENEDFSDFSHLSNIIKNNNSSVAAPSQPIHRDSRPIPKRPSFGTADRSETPSHYGYGTIDRGSSYGGDTLPRATTPSGQYYSGQERVAAAIARAETPTRQFYGGTQERASSTLGRAETPQFPVQNRGETPLPYHPLLYNQQTQSRAELREGREGYSHTMNHRSASPRSQYYGQLSRRSSLTSVDPGEIIHHHPVFVKDTSKYWYKPMISREQAISMLRDKSPGTFVVRDSNSFPGAFGLALKVATPPPGVQPGDGTELVRHFLIEPSPKGVKLKGCNNEPVFGSLSALVYQHSITPLALPARLILPEFDPATTPEHVSATQALLEQGAACNVSFVGTVDCESLTGSECVKRCISKCFEDTERGYVNPVSVHFKVSSQGVTLTDNTRKIFFRRHLPVQSVIYASADPMDRRWDNQSMCGFNDSLVRSARIFAVVARKMNTMDNQCHIFAELEEEQPATAVVNFINKVMLAQRRS